MNEPSEKSPKIDITRRQLMEGGAAAASGKWLPMAEKALAGAALDATQDFFGLRDIIQAGRHLEQFDQERSAWILPHFSKLSPPSVDKAFTDHFTIMQKFFVARQQLRRLFNGSMQKLLQTDFYWNQLDAGEKQGIMEILKEPFEPTEYDGYYPPTPIHTVTPEESKRLGAFLLRWFQHGDCAPFNQITIAHNSFSPAEYISDWLWDDGHSLLERMAIPNDAKEYVKFVEDFLKMQLRINPDHFMSAKAYRNAGLDKECGPYEKLTRKLENEIQQDKENEQQEAKKTLHKLLQNPLLQIIHIPRHNQNGLTSFGLRESYHLTLTEDPAELAKYSPYEADRLLRHTLYQALSKFEEITGCEGHLRQAGILRRPVVKTHMDISTVEEIDIIDPPVALKYLLDEAIKQRKSALINNQVR